MKPLRLILIAAVSRNGVLSSGGKIPWHMPGDIAHFRRRTAGGWLLMGRTTYEQMTGWFKSGQVPVVLTRQIDYEVPGGWAVSSLEEAMSIAAKHEVKELLVCGGAQVYTAALPWADEVILTTLDAEMEGDRWFPEMRESEWGVADAKVFPADYENAWSMTIRRMVRHLG